MPSIVIVPACRRIGSLDAAQPASEATTTRVTSTRMGPGDGLREGGRPLRPGADEAGGSPVWTLFHNDQALRLGDPVSLGEAGEVDPTR